VSSAYTRLSGSIDQGPRLIAPETAKIRTNFSYFDMTAVEVAARLLEQMAAARADRRRDRDLVLRSAREMCRADRSSCVKSCFGVRFAPPLAFGARLALGLLGHDNLHGFYVELLHEAVEVHLTPGAPITDAACDRCMQALVLLLAHAVVVQDAEFELVPLGQPGGWVRQRRCARSERWSSSGASFVSVVSRPRPQPAARLSPR